MKKKLLIPAIALCGAAAAAAGVWASGLLAPPRDPGPVEGITLMTATDLHYLSPSLTDHGPYFQSTVENADGKMTAYSGELLEAFVRQAAEEAPGALILSGDLTFNGEAQSHRELAAKLRQVEEAGIPVLVMPGNHDLENPMAVSFEGEGIWITESVTGEEFAEIYGAFGYEEALSRDRASLSYTYELAPNLRVLMVDANTGDYPGSAAPRTLSWVKSQLRDAARDGAWVVAVCHQNLLQHSSLFSGGYRLGNAGELLALFEEAPVICCLSGHIHIQHIAQSGGALREIVTSALAVSPNQYGLLELAGGDASYRTRPVDVAAWAAGEGLRDETLLEFSQTSRQFFWDTSRRQGAAEAGTGEEAQAMAAFFADVNTAYFAGRTDAVPWDEGLYQAWRERDNFIPYYLESIAADGFRDQTAAAFTFWREETP